MRVSTLIHMTSHKWKMNSKTKMTCSEEKKNAMNLTADEDNDKKTGSGQLHAQLKLNKKAKGNIHV